MRNIIRLTESELVNLVKKVISEGKKPQTKDEIKKFQSWVINTKKDKKILGTGGDSGFGDDGIWGSKTNIAWEKYGSSYVPNKVINNMADSLPEVAKIWYNKLTKGKNPDGNSSLLFDGKSLKWLSNGSVINSWRATSGVNLLNAEPNEWLTLAKNIFSSNKEKSKLKEFGPTPEGEYYVGKLQSSKLGKTNPFIDFIKVIFQSGQSKHDWNTDTAGSRISWGYYRATITPKSGTNTYGRGSFYVHGGALPASHGCIDLTSSMDDFAKFYSSWATKYKKNRIPLRVKYSSSFTGVVA